ncbi:hypothetical protein CLV92_1084 [Kineococcus xinjiangensis]|uniref:Uncharacterized protein n=1 Tax=Kineococcus xinjiangensis TaxID=512762 RepID=A0A2S6IIR5_9ACTN|nr:hypothetical protein [Kineococcus xinjiangensis]PPK94107.1 hypothetical protein CLV92_1084 [Kineococcus xinjiangensis]
MSDAREVSGRELPGHGPADPDGYSVTEVAEGYVWIRRADGGRSEPHPSRAQAVESAEADQRARGPRP